MPFQRKAESKKHLSYMPHALSMEIDERLKDPRVIGIAISIVVLLIIVALSALLIGDGDEDENGDGNELEGEQIASSPNSDYQPHPNVMTAEFTDLSMIEEISKFRSGAGHDFSNFGADMPEGCQVNIGDYFATVTDEPESSMKHYFLPYDEFRGDRSTVPVYAPFDGEITRVSFEESESGTQDHRVEFTSKDYPDYIAVIFHIDLVDKAPQALNDFPAECAQNSQADDEEFETKNYTAGELLGYADLRDHSAFDIAILWTREDGGRQWLSMFELLPPWVIDTYYTRGHDGSGKLLDDFSFSKSYRENNAVDWQTRDDNDWVTFPTTWRHVTVSNGSEIWSGDCANHAVNLGDEKKEIQIIRYDDLEKTIPKSWTNKTYNEAGNLILSCSGTPTEPNDQIYLYSYEENRQVFNSRSNSYDSATGNWEDWRNTSYSYDAKSRVVTSQWGSDPPSHTLYDDDARTSSTSEIDEEWGNTWYQNTTRDEYGRLIMDSGDSSWNYGEDRELYTTTYRFDEFGRINHIFSNNSYWYNMGGIFANESYVTTFSYENDSFTTMQIAEYSEEGEPFSCTISRHYEKSVGQIANPYHTGGFELNHMDYLLTNYRQVSTVENCDNSLDSYSMYITYSQNSDLLLQRISNSTSTSGVNTQTWDNYTYLPNGKLNNETKFRLINGTIDNSTFGRTMEEYVYNSTDPNRISTLKNSYSNFNYTSGAYDNIYVTTTVNDADGNKIEYSSYSTSSTYISCTVYNWA